MKDIIHVEAPVLMQRLIGRKRINQLSLTLALSLRERELETNA
jgi:hypothetical protein